MNGLAKLEGKSPLRVLIGAIRNQDEQQTNQDESVVFDLMRLLTSRGAKELTDVRPDLEKMATGAKLPVTRELGFAALIAADGGVDKAWDLATKSTTSLQDLVNAMPIIRDPEQRAKLYPKVLALLNGLPKELVSPTSNGKIVMGRYVRIELPGRRKTLTLAEVRSFQRRPQHRSSAARRRRAAPAYGGDASRAIDGNTSGNYNDGGERTPRKTPLIRGGKWTSASEHPISSIAIFNRTDDSLGKRLNDFTLKVLDNAHKVVYREGQAARSRRKSRLRRRRRVAGVGRPSRRHERPRFGARQGERYLRRHRSLRQGRRGSRRGGSCAATHPGSVLAQGGGAAVAERNPRSTSARFRSPNEPRRRSWTKCNWRIAWRRSCRLAEAKVIRKELGALGVRVIHLSTLTEQMLFDKDRIVVQAGKPVEIVFENNDLMPHNFVVLQPGSLEEIGTKNEAAATDPAAMARGYIPNSPKVLLASRLLQPRNSQRLNYTAPAQPGVYPYVCTYPGHWRRMYGAMYVVADLDEYRADPEGYMKRHPLKIEDEMLKYTGPRKEWKFAELAPLAERAQGRPFLQQRQASFPGGRLHLLSQDERRRQRVRPRSDEARTEAESSRRSAARHRGAVVPHQREVSDDDFHHAGRQGNHRLGHQDHADHGGGGRESAG